GVASPACAAASGAAIAVSAKRAIRLCLNICITRYFHASAGVSDGASSRRTDLVRIFPQIPALERVRPRLPCRFSLIELSLAELHVERALLGIEHDHVAVAKKCDRAAERGLWPDVADAESARCPGEAPVGDQRKLV